MITKTRLWWQHGGGMMDWEPPLFSGCRISATTRLTTDCVMHLWSGGTRRHWAPIFRLGRWQWHLMMCHVCCISPLMVCFCPTRVWQGPRLWRWWWSIWGLIWGDTLKEVTDTKGGHADLATWGEFSKSVFWSCWRRTMRVIWFWCRSCGSRLSAYICYTWWITHSSLTRTRIMWMLLIWSTSEIRSLWLVMHGELLHFHTCTWSLTMSLITIPSIF